jgi:hypothetical protein
MIDGTIFASCDQTLGELWRMNIGSSFKVPPLGLQPYDDVELPLLNTDLVRNECGRAPPYTLRRHCRSFCTDVNAWRNLFLPSGLCLVMNQKAARRIAISPSRAHTTILDGLRRSGSVVGMLGLPPVWGLDRPAAACGILGQSLCPIAGGCPSQAMAGHRAAYQIRTRSTF